MKKLAIICLIIFILTTLISFILANNTINTINSVNHVCATGEIQYINGVGEAKCISSFLSFFILFTLTMIILNVPLTSIYLFAFLIYRTYRLNNKRIKNDDLIYQRELPDYNCAVASYILDGIINVDKDVDALLLELKEEKVITINCDNIEVNEDMMKIVDTKPHHNSTKYLLSTIANKQQLNKKIFKTKVIQDAKELGFSKESGRIFSIIILSVIFHNLVSIFSLIALIVIDKKNGILTELFYKLTTKGSLEKDKLLKLKKFLISFSTINELKATEKTIWGRYVPFYLVMKD